MNNNIISTNNKRESGVELFRIIGIFLIVVSHVIQTLESDFSSLVGFNDYYVNISQPTFNIQVLFCGILRYSGVVGNSMFFICSAWYLIDKKQTNVKKVFRMLGEIWFISILWLITTLLFTNFELSQEHIVFSFTPSLRMNNWYLTLYMMFCFIFPFLNILIKHLSKRQHLIVAIVLLITCIVMPFKVTFPYSSDLLLWVAVYFIVAYLKIYSLEICNNIKINRIILISFLLFQLLLIILGNYLSLYTDIIHITITHWLTNFNLYILLFVFAAFNLFRNKRFYSSKINYLASFSMLVYIIHENKIFRQYYRPTIWQWIHLYLGYDLLILWVLLYVCILFILSYVIAIVYRLLLQKYIYKIIDIIYDFIKRIGNYIINKIENVIN